MIDIKRIYDVMPELSGNEFKVLFYLAEGCSYANSLGIDKFEASYSQIRKYTGINQNHTISSALKTLEEKGFIKGETHFISGKQKSTTLFTCIFSTPKNGVINTEKCKKGTNSSAKKELPSSAKKEQIIMKRKNKEINKLNNTNSSSTSIENESTTVEQRETGELESLYKQPHNLSEFWECWNNTTKVWKELPIEELKNLWMYYKNILKELLPTDEGEQANNLWSDLDKEYTRREKNNKLQVRV